MKVFAKVLGLNLLIFFAAIVGGRAKAPQQETTQAGEALYKQRRAACHEGAVPGAPNRVALKEMSPENVRSALLRGSMEVEGLLLSLAGNVLLAFSVDGK